MVDGTGRFAGEVANVLAAKTSLRIHEDLLVSLTGRTFNDTFPGMIPSAGGCDEAIQLFLYRKQVTETELGEMRGQLDSGKPLAQRPGVIIAMDVLPLKDLWKATADSKALASFLLYSKLRETGALI